MSHSPGSTGMNDTCIKDLGGNSRDCKFSGEKNEGLKKRSAIFTGSSKLTVELEEEMENVITERSAPCVALGRGFEFLDLADTLV